MNKQELIDNLKNILHLSCINCDEIIRCFKKDISCKTENTIKESISAIQNN